MILLKIRIDTISCTEAVESNRIYNLLTAVERMFENQSSELYEKKEEEREREPSSDVTGEIHLSPFNSTPRMRRSHPRNVTAERTHGPLLYSTLHTYTRSYLYIYNCEQETVALLYRRGKVLRSFFDYICSRYSQRHFIFEEKFDISKAKASYILRQNYCTRLRKFISRCISL